MCSNANFQVGGTRIRIGGMAKGSGMIHPNMGTLLGVCKYVSHIVVLIYHKHVANSLFKIKN